MIARPILTGLISIQLAAFLIVGSACSRKHQIEKYPAPGRLQKSPPNNTVVVKENIHHINFVKGDRKIDVLIGGKVFTSYLYGEQLDKPILFPIYSPSAVMVTRGYPLLEVDGEAKNHPHHKGLWFAYRKVNDDDFWLEPASSAHIRHMEVTEMTPGDSKGRLSTVAHWAGKTGRVLLEEKRDMVFYASDKEYTIDFSIDLTARDKKVIFKDDKDGMFAIHVAHWLNESDGSGSYFNSNGDEQAENTWGKRARWVCLQGRKDGKIIGVAVLNHPASVNFPTYWHTRGYGLFTANPLGQYVFERKRNLNNPQPFQLTLRAGQTAHFRFRIIIYEGQKTNEQMEKRFKEFAK